MSAERTGAFVSETATGRSRGWRRAAVATRWLALPAAAMVAAMVAALAATGCAGGEAAPPSIVFPTGFRPPPPLGDAPEAEPDALGADYLARVAPRFARPWRAFLDDLRLRLPPTDPLNQASLTVALELELDPDGGLVALRVAAPSGNRAFDDAAREVAGEAVPLAPPPAELLSDDQHLYLGWRFSRDVRQAGPASARIRRVEWPLERAVPQLIARGRVGQAARRVATAAESVASEAAQGPILARFRDVCAAALAQALSSDDAARAVAGVAAVVEARLISAAPDLRRLARGSIDAGVRRAALRALGQLGDRGALPLLREVAMAEGGQAAEQSGAAAEALAAMGQDGEVRAMAAARLRSPSELERWTALAIMTQVPVPEAASQLVAILRGAGGAARAERITAAAALGAVAAGAGEPARAREPAAHPEGGAGEGARMALAALTDCLAVADGAQRAACAEAIAGAAAAGARSRPAYARLIRLLRDRDESVRAAAALAAARLDPARFAGSMAALGRERSELVLVALARGLAGVPGPRAVARLARLAHGASPSVRLAAATALAGREDARAATALARLAGHEDAAVRAVAVRALRRPDVLRAAMRGDAPEVSAAALAALVALEGQWQTLPDAAQLLSELPAGSTERTLAVRAWLRP
ncbi:MAG TPA: TonB family protein [Kofleriaceae bacterium]|nr:TonB family protein [Kofleriaceae bacterium]